MQIRESYYIGPFTLDSVAKNPIGSLEALEKYDLAIIAKPTETFSDEEKQVLDQFIINGGKTLWLIDQVAAEMDSLYNQSGATLAYPRDLNLNDMFFKYGFELILICKRRTRKSNKISYWRTRKCYSISGI